MTPPRGIEAVTAAIRANAYRFATEDKIQRGIGAALTNAEIAHEREVRLGPADRIDFLVGAVGVEVKIGGGITPLTRQLTRYALSGRVEALILVTSKRRHAAQLPPALNGKPV